MLLKSNTVFYKHAAIYLAWGTKLQGEQDELELLLIITAFWELGITLLLCVLPTWKNICSHVRIKDFKTKKNKKLKKKIKKNLKKEEKISVQSTIVDNDNDYVYFTDVITK